MCVFLQTRQILRPEIFCLTTIHLSVSSSSVTSSKRICLKSKCSLSLFFSCSTLFFFFVALITICSYVFICLILYEMSLSHWCWRSLRTEPQKYLFIFAYHCISSILRNSRQWINIIELFNKQNHMISSNSFTFPAI